MKLKLYSLAILFFVLTGFLFADELTPANGWYVRIDAGFSSALDPEVTIPDGPLPADLGTSPVFGGGFGLSYVPGLRVDLTVTQRSGFEHISGFPSMPSGQADFKSLVTLVSGYLDLYSTARISPYGGFGIGFAHNELERITIHNTDGSLLGTIDGTNKTNFAWQLCAGAAVQLTNHFLLDVGYHFLKAGDYESDDELIFPDGSTDQGRTLGKFRSHEILVSLQYVF